VLSKDWFDKVDSNLRRFIFILNQSHNIPALRFGLKPEERGAAICCDSARGSHFYDVIAFNDCTANTSNSVFNFGLSGIKDTELDGRMFYMGSKLFQVKEIEMFRITA
jgi:hypothetical protein